MRTLKLKLSRARTLVLGSAPAPDADAEPAMGSSRWVYMANMDASSPCSHSSAGAEIFEAGTAASQDLAIEVVRARRQIAGMVSLFGSRHSAASKCGRELRLIIVSVVHDPDREIRPTQHARQTCRSCKSPKGRCCLPQIQCGAVRTICTTEHSSK